MSKDKIIAIGASAGGLPIISKILSALPKDFPASVLFVMHIAPGSPGMLPDMLQQHSKLPVRHPRDGESIIPSHVYVAPPNKHMLIRKWGKIQLSYGPRINRSRPAIDPMFRSVAMEYRNRSIGIILTGLLDDGTMGLCAIKRLGGVTIVQDPKQAEYPEMPLSALRNVSVDYCMPVEEIAPLLIRLVNEGPSHNNPPTEGKIMEVESDVEKNMTSSAEQLDKIGSPSCFTCPDCHGTLWEINDEKVLRFRCRVGHAFGEDNLDAALTENVENALWAALRILEESANLSQRLAERNSQPASNETLKQRFVERAAKAKQHAKIIREILLGKHNI